MDRPLKRNAVTDPMIDARSYGFNAFTAARAAARGFANAVHPQEALLPAALAMAEAAAKPSAFALRSFKQIHRTALTESVEAAVSLGHQRMSLLTEEALVWVSRSIEFACDPSTVGEARRFVAATGDDHPAHPNPAAAGSPSNTRQPGEWTHRRDRSCDAGAISRRRRFGLTLPPHPFILNDDTLVPHIGTRGP